MNRITKIILSVMVLNALIVVGKTSRGSLTGSLSFFNSPQAEHVLTTTEANSAVFVQNLLRVFIGLPQIFVPVTLHPAADVGEPAEQFEILDEISVQEVPYMHPVIVPQSLIDGVTNTSPVPSEYLSPSTPLFTYPPMPTESAPSYYLSPTHPQSTTYPVFPTMPMPPSSPSHTAPAMPTWPMYPSADSPMESMPNYNHPDPSSDAASSVYTMPIMAMPLMESSSSALGIHMAPPDLGNNCNVCGSTCYDQAACTKCQGNPCTNLGCPYFSTTQCGTCDSNPCMRGCPNWDPVMCS